MMSQCNSEQCHSCDETRKQLACPNSHQDCQPVALSLVLLHLKQPWSKALKEQIFFYCDDPTCDIVYFSADGFTITNDQLRAPLAYKDKQADSQLCFCFDIRLSDFKQNTALKNYVVEKTKNGSCACKTQHPAGRCCLKDFSRL
ncbi:MAG: hypothetical protein OEZ58_09040 [Gammaproteobacteria bacterium]|nr:hypothetical protein [Gammaproteobacteria bacterium]MDH5729122.1 hypothetical protein [Gammaproteobacteria bacterium]